MGSISGLSDELKQVDWSFSALGNSGIHALHWYPATFIGAIPGTLIPHLAPPGGVVLDPFCGSGTTGVEALRLGYRFIGLDNNPVAILISRAKLYFPDPKNFERVLEDVIDAAQPLAATDHLSAQEHPQEKELRGWYHSETFNELNHLLYAILAIRNKELRQCFLAIFSGILKTTSSQGKHWGWVCDNVKPRPEELTYKNALGAFSSAAKEYIRNSDAAFAEAQHHGEKSNRKVLRARSELLTGDSVATARQLPRGSIDLILTSPPYYGVADYVKAQRLTFLWLDVDALSPYRLGFRYFKTLRESEAGSRSHRHRQNSYHLYMEFMLAFFDAAKAALKPGGRLALVVGESKARQSTLQAIAEGAEEAGLTKVFQGTRDIKMTRRRLMAKVNSEEILVFEK